MIQSYMNNQSQNVSSNRNNKLEQSLKRSISKQQSRIINISDNNSEGSKANSKG